MMINKKEEQGLKKRRMELMNQKNDHCFLDAQESQYFKKYGFQDSRHDKESSLKKLSSIVFTTLLIVIAGVILIYASSMTYLSPTPGNNSYTAAGSCEFNISIDNKKMLFAQTIIFCLVSAKAFLGSEKPKLKKVFQMANLSEVKWNFNGTNWREII